MTEPLLGTDGAALPRLPAPPAKAGEPPPGRVTPAELGDMIGGAWRLIIASDTSAPELIRRAERQVEEQRRRATKDRQDWLDLMGDVRKELGE